jgi:hypothetical protein
MPYTVEASSASPALIIYLLDVSRSMNELLDGTPRITRVNQAIEKVLVRMARLSLRGDRIAPRYRLAMIAYSDTPMDILGGVRPINEVVELGKPVLQTVNATNTHDAFVAARDILRDEIPRARGLTRRPAPMVCHLTDGQFTGDDPEPVAHEIMGMATDDGPVLVENVFIGSDLLERPVADISAWGGVASQDELSSAYAKKLFAMSSELPDSYAATMAREGYAMRAGARMLIPGVSRELIELAFAMSRATPVGAGEVARVASGLD